MLAIASSDIKFEFKQLEEVRGQLQATVSSSVAAQKKMSSTLTTITQQAQGVQRLQSQRKMDTAQLECLRQELAEKKSNIGSLQEKVKLMIKCLMKR